MSCLPNMVQGPALLTVRSLQTGKAMVDPPPISHFLKQIS